MISRAALAGRLLAALATAGKRSAGEAQAAGGGVGLAWPPVSAHLSTSAATHVAGRSGLAPGPLPALPRRTAHALALPDENERRPRKAGERKDAQASGGDGAAQPRKHDAGEPSASSPPARGDRAGTSAGRSQGWTRNQDGDRPQHGGGTGVRQQWQQHDRSADGRAPGQARAGAPWTPRHRNNNNGGGGWAEWSPAPVVGAGEDGQPAFPASTWEDRRGTGGNYRRHQHHNNDGHRRWVDYRRHGHNNDAAVAARDGGADGQASSSSFASTWTDRRGMGGGRGGQNNRHQLHNNDGQRKWVDYRRHGHNNDDGGTGQDQSGRMQQQHKYNLNQRGRTWSGPRRDGGGGPSSGAAPSPNGGYSGGGHHHPDQHRWQHQRQRRQWVSDPDDRPFASGRRDGRRWVDRGGQGDGGGHAQGGLRRFQQWQQRDDAATAAAERRRKAAAAAAAAAASASRVEAADISIPAGVTVRELARLLDVGVDALEEALAGMGARPGSEEEAVEPDAAELVALELGKAVSVERPPEVGGPGAAATPRPPVVAVLGHVDHGKTTLLDALRNTAVAAGEAGGITQHIGAFEVAMPESSATITFLDTPGHAAFSAMRSRGAHLTDIAVLVVDARDGVKPQTREAIAHINAAGCPLVVALTKCDLPDADPAGVRRQLLGEGLELEEAGGSVQAVEVAAKAGRGLRELEEALLLQAELMELRAAVEGRTTEATVVEARMDKGQGPVATVIVTAGALEPGQAVVVGAEWGKVRSVAAPDGRVVDRVLPGHPAEVTGLRGVPNAGDTLTALPSEDRARRLGTARAQRAEERRQAATAAGAAEAVAADAAAAAVAAATRKAGRRGAPPAAVAAAAAAAADLASSDAAAAAAATARVLLVVKADTQGSAEAVTGALEALALDGVRVSVASAAVGPVTLSDIQHAAAIGARVLAFGVRTGGAPVEREAKRLGVPLEGERVIYRLLDAVAGWVAGAAPRVGKEVIAGRAEVLQVFGGSSSSSASSSAAATAVAGVRVGEGAITKGEAVRVVRGGATIHGGPCTSLRRHKLDVNRVGKGTECGVVLEGFADFRAGDILQCVVTEYVTPSAEDVLAQANGGSG